MYSGSRSRGQNKTARVMAAAGASRMRRMRRLFMKLFCVSRVNFKGSNHRVGSGASYEGSARRLKYGVRRQTKCDAALRTCRVFPCASDLHFRRNPWTPFPRLPQLASSPFQPLTSIFNFHKSSCLFSFGAFFKMLASIDREGG